MPQTDTTALLRSTLDVADALVGIAKAAASFADSNFTAPLTKPTWLETTWFESGECLRRDYRLMNATCSKERIADLNDPCSVPRPRHLEQFVEAAFHPSFVSRKDIQRTALVLDFMKPAQDSFFAKLSGGNIPAVVHQTWKSIDVGAETDFKELMDEWQSDRWAHVIWDDTRLNGLINFIAPWIRPTLQRMFRPIDKIDTMRYFLLFVFGGIYLDADMLRINGDLEGMFKEVPEQGVAACLDPSIIASDRRHPIMAQMLQWIISRTHHSIFGGRHELTGPEAWRRVLSGYRGCEHGEEKSFQANWPTSLFNQEPCACGGSEILRKGDGDLRGGVRAGETAQPIPLSDGDFALGLIHTPDVPIRGDSARLTRAIILNGHRVSNFRVNHHLDGPAIRSTRACVAFHRCTRIYGRGIADWDGGVSLGGSLAKEGESKD